jgi:hypothetical protein
MATATCDQFIEDIPENVEGKVYGAEARVVQLARLNALKQSHGYNRRRSNCRAVVVQG